jgi:hypothetical protein
MRWVSPSQKKLNREPLRNWTIGFSNEEVAKAYEHSRRKVVIAAHTFPFLDGTVLNHALKQLGTQHKIYTKGLFGFGPVWCEEVTEGGFVSRETNKLNKLPDFCRAIFPSGGTVR